jgi:hypothetical protein
MSKPRRKKRGHRKTSSKKPARAVDARSHAGRRGGAALEESAGKPSRKSTRASSDRTKRTTSLQLRATMRQHSPPSRHQARRH